MDRIRQMATRTSDLGDNVHQAANTSHLGPRTPGTVYDDGVKVLEVVEVITDPAEASRLLHRDSATFAVLVHDLHADYRYFTGDAWTSSHYVLEAAA
jgi:hypothetical protein